LAWTVEWDDRAIREAKTLDPTWRRRIQGYLRSRIATSEDPRRFGKPLLGNKAGLWRYRVGDYRIVCRIEDSRVVVLVLAAGHRSKIYD
jgi:mRNA interferase RelE/StbE